MLTDGKLTQDNVLTIIVHALYRPEEAPEDGSYPPDAVVAEGIAADFGFHPTRLHETREDLLAMFDEIDEQYFTEHGFTFLFLRFNKDRIEWTDTGLSHGFKYVEALMCLAMAQGLARYPIPRYLWGLMPGRAPFVELSRTGFPATLEA